MSSVATIGTKATGAVATAQHAMLSQRDGGTIKRYNLCGLPLKWLRKNGVLTQRLFIRRCNRATPKIRIGIAARGVVRHGPAKMIGVGLDKKVGMDKNATKDAITDIMNDVSMIR